MPIEDSKRDGKKAAEAFIHELRLARNQCPECGWPGGEHALRCTSVPIMDRFIGGD